MYDSMMEAFDLLPLACIINNSYFCVHGGISDKLIDVNIRQNRSRRSIAFIESSKYLLHTPPFVILFGPIQ